MKLLFAFAIASALSLSAQNQTPAPAPAAPGAKPAVEVVPGAAPNTYQVRLAAPKPVPIGQLPASTVVATVDGQKVTAGQLQAILRSVPAQLQQKIEGDRKEFVTQYAMFVRLVDMARKEKLDQQSPYKENIEYQTMVVLQAAAVDQQGRSMSVKPEDIQKSYDANRDRYTQVKFKAIYIPFNTSATSAPDASGKALPVEADAKAKADDLVKQARAGADFVKLVRENSGDPTSVAKDGDFPPVHKNDKGVPQDIVTALFAAKQGDVTDPVRQPRGFYVFKIVESGAQPLAQVQDSIKTELQNEQLKKWLDDLKASIQVKMEEEPAAQAPVPSVSVVPSQK
jgi:parvulin-like peptidyl-prolyl isomerase